MKSPPRIQNPKHLTFCETPVREYNTITEEKDSRDW